MNNCLGTSRIDVISMHRQDTLRECISQPLSSRPQERALESMKDGFSEKLDHNKSTRIHSGGRGNVVPVNVNNIECSGVIDTGADGTVISSCFARDARIDTSSSKMARLLNAGDGAAFLEVSLRNSKMAVIPPNGKSMQHPYG